jgi:hypothetical protein
MPAKAVAAKKKVAPVVEEVKPVVSPSIKFWMTLASLIAGGISFVGFVLLSNLNVTLSETIQIVSIFVLALLAIGALVLSVLAILPGPDGDTTHKWLGLNIIAFGISFLMFDKFISPLISVITYLLKKKAA